jgi:hypothetical protein
MPRRSERTPWDEDDGVLDLGTADGLSIGRRLDTLALAIQSLHNGVRIFETYRVSEHARHVQRLLDAERKLSER